MPSHADEHALRPGPDSGADTTHQGVGQQQQELLRVLAATDLHVDYAENMRWCQQLDSEAHRRDVLVVSGDVSDELGALEEALGCLAAKFAAVFYVPGNHELWIREKDRAAGLLDSLTKLHQVLDLCQRLGVHTQPRRLGNLWLVPLFSWHHKCFDQEPDIPGVPSVSTWTVADYGACRWPHSVPGGDSLGSLELARWFDRLNDTPAWHHVLASQHECDVIALAHFLPHQALLPEKRYLYYPGLAKAVGSAPLAARLAALQPDLCLIGHTHFSWDAVLHGVRYIQAPLGSPLERRRRLMTLGFGGSMEAARDDPEAARWLPLLVYQGLVPRGAVDALRAGEAGAAAAAGPVAAMPAAEELAASFVGAAAAAAEGPALPASPVKPAAVVAAPSAIAAPASAAGPVEAGTRAAKGQRQQAEAQQQAQQPQQTQQPQQQQRATHQRQMQQPSHEQPTHQQQAPHQQQQQEFERQLLSSWATKGWHPLRHGMLAPPLQAHWSDHYASNPRRPEDVVMAPWVGKLYERRRQRAAVRGGSGSSSGASESGSDAEVDSGG